MTKKLMAIFWKLQTVVVFSVSQETKFEVDTNSVMLKYLHYLRNVNKYLDTVNTPTYHVSKALHDKINKVLF